MDESNQPWSVLKSGTGSWEGSETMPPAPWAPDGLEATGRLSCRLVCGGTALSSDYTQLVGDEISMSSHTLIRWRQEEGDFEMQFSPRDGELMLLSGRRDGDSVIFEGSGPGGAPMRQTMTWHGDRISVRSETPDPSGGYMLTFSGEYTRT